MYRHGCVPIKLYYKNSEPWSHSRSTSEAYEAAGTANSFPIKQNTLCIWYRTQHVVRGDYGFVTEPQLIYM